LNQARQLSTKGIGADKRRRHIGKGQNPAVKGNRNTGEENPQTVRGGFGKRILGQAKEKETLTKLIKSSSETRSVPKFRGRAYQPRWCDKNAN